MSISLKYLSMSHTAFSWRDAEEDSKQEYVTLTEDFKKRIYIMPLFDKFSQKSFLNISETETPSGGQLIVMWNCFQSSRLSQSCQLNFIFWNL